MLRWLLILPCLGPFSATPVVAQVRASDISAATEGTDAWAYLRGLKDGIEWAIARSGFDKEPPPFCPPPNLTIAAEQYRQILADQIRLHPDQAQHYAGLVLMDSLKRTFPCSGKP